MLRRRVGCRIPKATAFTGARRTSNQTNLDLTRRWNPTACRCITADPIKSAGGRWLCWCLDLRLVLRAVKLSCAASSIFFSVLNFSGRLESEHERRRRDPVYWQQNKFDFQGADSLPGDFVICRYWKVHSRFGQRWVSVPRGVDYILCELLVL